MSRRVALLSRAAFAALAVLPGLVFFYAAVTQRASLSHGMFHDDAYYYFAIARNLAAGRGSTFNGIDRTNGYHPAWLALLTVLALVARGRDAFLVGVAVLEGVLWALAVRQIERIGTTLRRPIPALFAGAALVSVGAINLRLSFNGMESVIVVVILLAVARSWIVAPAEPRLTFGLLLALLALCRLDAVFVIGGLLALRLVSIRRLWRRLLLRELAPPAIAIIGYMAISEAYFGTPLPVSGQAKSLGAPFWNAAPIVAFLKAGATGHQPLWLGLVAAIMTLLALLATRRDQDLRVRWAPALRFIAGTWIGTAAWISYLTLFTPGTPPAWYLTALVILVPLPLAVLVDAVGATGDLITRALGFALATVGLFMVIGLFTGPLRNASIGDPFVETAPHNASVLRSILPGHHVLAMGDRAGALAYESGLPFVQLEGLVESEQFLGAMSNGTVKTFMASRHVDVYLRSGGASPAETTVDGQAAEQFREPFQGRGPRTTITVLIADRLARLDAGKGETLDVFRYRPELNP